jgi:tetracycline resistance efflux pump
MEYGIWSLLPPIAAIALAIKTKQVYISLGVGIWLGWMAISNWNPLTGTLATIEALVNVFADPGNTRTIMFSALVGALIMFIQRSGGVQGFILYLEHKLLQQKEKDNRKAVQAIAASVGILVFVESSISVLTVGALFRPVFDKMHISREKLAYIADSSSAPICVLIPLNAWGAFVMGLLITQGYDQPFAMMINSIAYNFYPILAIILVFALIFSGKDFGPMRKAEKRTRDGEIIWPDARPMVADEITAVEPKEGITPRARNMFIPLATMVFMMPVMLAFTGWDAAGNGTFIQRFFTAIGNGSGSTSVLVSVMVAIFVSMILYAAQRMFKLHEMVDLTMKGISGLMPLALLMLLAFAMVNVCKNLETGLYIAEITRSWLSPGLVPFVIFLTSSFIAFSTGTSWGTFGIMIAIGIPMAQALGANEVMVIAAVLGGGVFGDHSSPISDTTIIASMASASDHIDHVRTQLPYALVIGGITAVMYLIAGLL